MPKTTKSKLKTSDCNRLERPLNNYNLFYILEREAFLQQRGVRCNKEPASEPASKFEIQHYADLVASFPPPPARYAKLKLSDDWFLKRQPPIRRKTHGAISFADLSASIARKWKTVDPELKTYVTTIAAMINRRRDEGHSSMRCLKAQKSALLERPAPSSKEVDDALSTPTPSTRRVSMNSVHSSFSSAEVDFNNFNQSSCNQRQDALSSSSSASYDDFSRSCSSIANIVNRINFSQDAFSKSSSIDNQDIFSQSNSIRAMSSMWMPESQPNYGFSPHHQTQMSMTSYLTNNFGAFSGTDAIEEELKVAELPSHSPSYASAPAAMISVARSTPFQPIDSPNEVDSCPLNCQVLQESHELLQVDLNAQDLAYTDESPAIDWAERFAGAREWTQDFMSEINRWNHQGAPSLKQVKLLGPSSVRNGEKSSEEKKFGMVDLSDDVIREMFATL